MELANETVVVTATQFNPSLFSQLFLVRVGVASEEEFGPTIQTPALSQISTNRYELLITPDRLQFSPLGDEAAKEFAVKEILGTIVKSLPHTPYAAAGLNFHWLADLPNMSDETRRMFLKPDNPLATEFQDGNAGFGAYFSKDVLGGRLRVNIKPITRNTDAAQLISMDMNFDFQIGPGASAELICEKLANWKEAKEYSARLASLLDTARQPC